MSPVPDSPAGPVPWLNGWARLGTSAVLIGTGVHCIGCGRFYGVTCVAFTEGWKPPEQLPDWPFREGDCPVCLADDPRGAVRDVRMSDLKAGMQWLLEGSWVRVVRVLARGPGERVSVAYEQDGEQATTREYRGFERAAVR